MRVYISPREQDNTHPLILPDRTKIPHCRLQSPRYPGLGAGGRQFSSNTSALHSTPTVEAGMRMINKYHPFVYLGDWEEGRQSWLGRLDGMLWQSRDVKQEKTKLWLGR